ncbi:transposase family protein, partial [Shigella flexneri]|nr:transposase family protein [Shigella flexneri]
KHARARNVIERTFGVLKKRWAVLRSPTFYPIETQNKIILACALLHNFIRESMPEDPLEALDNTPPVPDTEEEPELDYIGSVESSEEWNRKRDQMAHNMF